MKRCSDCQQTKHTSEFRKRQRAKDGLQNACKDCQRKRIRAHCIANRNKLAAYKESKPCADCDQFFPACAMDLDHGTQDKKKGVAQMMNYSWNAIWAEVQKCELVCANCHRVRTHLNTESRE